MHALQMRVQELELELRVLSGAPDASSSSSLSAETSAFALASTAVYPLSNPVASIPAAFPCAAFLFDMDGTLVESKEIWYFLGYGGLQHDVWAPTYGQSMQQNRSMFFPDHAQSVIDDFCEEHYVDYIEHLRVLPGAEVALRATLAAVGGDPTRMAICTNCPLAITRLIVERCPVLREFFDASRTVCTGTIVALDASSINAHPGQLSKLDLGASHLECVSRGEALEYVLSPKPSSDLIYAAAQVLGVPAAHCVFVGDSKFDLMASIAAGCFAIGIGDKAKGGHMHIDSIAQLTDKIEQRMQQ